MLTVVHWVPSTSLSEALRSKLMVKENLISGKGSFFIDHPRVMPAGPHSNKVAAEWGAAPAAERGATSVKLERKNLILLPPQQPHSSRPESCCCQGISLPWLCITFNHSQKITHSCLLIFFWFNSQPIWFSICCLLEQLVPILLTLFTT